MQFSPFSKFLALIFAASLVLFFISAKTVQLSSVQMSTLVIWLSDRCCVVIFFSPFLFFKRENYLLKLVSDQMLGSQSVSQSFWFQANRSVPSAERLPASTMTGS